MDMEVVNIPAQLKVRGSGSVTVVPGQHLKIETSPGGQEVLDWENTTGETVSGSIEAFLTKE